MDAHGLDGKTLQPGADDKTVLKGDEGGGKETKRPTKPPPGKPKPTVAIEPYAAVRFSVSDRRPADTQPPPVTPYRLSKRSATLPGTAAILPGDDRAQPRPDRAQPRPDRVPDQTGEADAPWNKNVEGLVYADLDLRSCGSRVLLKPETVYAAIIK